MREILTFFAAVLVVALTAALVGPYFVNWTAQRGLIEAQLSNAFGARVRIAGPVSLTLLPTPSLSVADVTVESRKPGGPSLAVRRADFELATTALLRGEIQFLRADLERPTLTVALAPDGGLSLPTAPSDLPARVAFEDVGVRDATLIIRRTKASPWTIRDVDMQARVASLSGPFSATGVVGAGADAVSFGFETGAENGQTLPAQAQISWKARDMAATFSGALALSPGRGAKKISFHGAVSAHGRIAVPNFQSLPFALDGPISVAADGATFDKASFRLGAETTGLQASASGKAGFDAGAPITLSFAAQQSDADRFFASLGKDAGRRLLDAVLKAVSDDQLLSGATRPLHVAAKAPAVTIGGDSVSAIDFTLDADKGAPPRISLSCDGPGGATLSWRGALETGTAAVARGRLDVAADDVKRLAQWLSPAFPQTAALLRASPFQSLGLRGEVSASAVDFDGRELTLTADGSALNGSIAYTAAVGGARARLFADLDSNALDLDSLPDLIAPAKGLADLDLDLTLDARAVRLTHFGDGMVDAGRVRAKLRKTGARLTLDDLELSNVGGASLKASGHADEAGGELDVALNAAQLEELADLARRVAPGALSDALAARAVALSPARLNAQIGVARASDGSYRPTTFALNGTARGATIAGALRPDAGKPSREDLTFDLAGPDSSILVRQLGLEPLPLADTGAGRVDLRAHSDADGALQGAVAASLAGANISFVGSVKNWTSAPKARGSFTLTSDDAAPFLRLMTFVLPDPSQSLPLTLHGEAQVAAGSLALSGVAGEILHDPVSGAASLSSSALGLSAHGALSVQSLSLPTLASFALGPFPPQPGGGWSTSSFAPGLAAPPDTHMLLDVKRFDFGEGAVARDAKFMLDASSGLVALNDASMTLGGGTIAGALALRRDGTNASLTAQIDAHGVAVDRPTLSGAFSGRLSFAASGSSLSDLVQGFAGGGSLTAANFSAPRAAPSALALLMLESDKDGFKIDAASVKADLAKKFDAGPFTARRVDFDVETAGGRTQLSSTAVDAPGDEKADAKIAVGLNLKSLALDERVAFTAKTPPSEWPDKMAPSVAVVWREPRKGAPKRSIDADALIADLSARAAAREAQGISILNQDIQERAYFERRMKGLAFMHRREAEVAKWKAEQAREKAEQAAIAKAQAAASLKPPTALVPPPALPPPPIGLDPLSAGRF